MKLGILGKPKTFVLASLMLGLLELPAAAKDTPGKEGHYAQILDGRLSPSTQDDSPSKQVQHTRPDVQLDWAKVMAHSGVWVHIKYHEDSRDYLCRVIKGMQSFLAEFENTYDVHVVWKDRFNTRTDMTTAFTRYVYLAQAVKEMSIYPVISTTAMELFKENISTSALIGYGEDINKSPEEQLPDIWGNAWMGTDSSSSKLHSFSLAQVPSCKNHVHVNWSKVIVQVNSWIRVRGLEDAGSYLSRVEEAIKLFLTSFEDAYGVHVFWEDFDRPYPEVTLKFSGFVILVQALKETLPNRKILQEITQLFKKKNSAAKEVS